MSLFARAQLAPADPILGLTEAFTADPRAEKVNLGVGVYLGDDGKLPLMASVREAQERLTAEHKPRPQRRQSQKRSAGNGKALQNRTQEASVPEFCFHVFSPPLPKGMFVRTEKEPAEVNWKRPRRFLNIFKRAKRDFSEVSAYLLNFFRISACWPQVIFPSGHLPETKHVGP